MATLAKNVLRLEKVTIGGKQTDLEKVRDYIMKVKRHPDGASIFSNAVKGDATAGLTFITFDRDV